MPTLIEKGNLYLPSDRIKQEELDKWVPADFIAAELYARVGPEPKQMSDRVFVFKGMTGSGKSTGFLITIYDKFYTPGKAIICTQPRILTTQENAKEVCNIDPRFKIGENIGFSTSIAKDRAIDGINYVTIGTLLGWLTTKTDDEIMTAYNFFLLDEAHERSQELDMTIYLLREFYRRNLGNAALPFTIMMSATFNFEKYAAYFGVPIATNAWIVKGTSFERRVVPCDITPANYMDAIVDRIVAIHRENAEDDPNLGDIIAFMPGISDMLKVQSRLEAINKKEFAQNAALGQIDVIKLDRSGLVGGSDELRRKDMTIEEVRRALRNDAIRRRVYLATVVAETGLTLGPLKYCVDAGLRTTVDYSPITRGLLIYKGPSTRGQLDQRKGRIGRRFPGIYYPLYTEDVREQLQEDSFPDLFVKNIDRALLELMYIGGEVPAEFEVPEFLDRLPTLNVRASFYVLRRLGFYCTQLGYFASRLPFKESVESARLVLSGMNWGCHLDDVIIMAIMSEMQVRDYAITKHGAAFNPQDIITDMIPKTVQKNISNCGLRLVIADQFIERIFIYRYFLQGIQHCDFNPIKIRKWCEQRGLIYKGAEETSGMLYVLQKRDEIIAALYEMGFHPRKDYSAGRLSIVDCVSHDEFMLTLVRLKRCIYESFGHKLAHFDISSGKYIAEHGLAIEVPEDYSFLNCQNIVRKNISLRQKPQTIVYNSITTSYSKKTQQFESKTELISVMDGFVQC